MKNDNLGNGKKVAVMQPTYLPWLGYFNLMASVDVFVILDDVYFSKNSFHNRNRIKLRDKAHYLTIPVIHKLGTYLCDQKIDITQKWQKKHIETVRQAYLKAEYFNDYFNYLEELINNPAELLCDITIPLIKCLKAQLGINAEIYTASQQIGLKAFDDPVERLLDLLKINDCSIYLSPGGSKVYLERSSLLHRNGISVWYQDYQHPYYRQGNGDFIPYLSVLDLLYNEGHSSLNIIKLGSKFVKSIL